MREVLSRSPFRALQTVEFADAASETVQALPVLLGELAVE
jgi:hypothetical protein